MNIKKIPYGMTDFIEIVTENYYYVDKTKFIENIENSSNFLFFIRPRRFGKSLWINTMAAYYDKNFKDDFNTLFGNLYIGKYPTGNQNKYLILQFNFSKINSDDLKESFESHCDTQFDEFIFKYQKYFDIDIREKLAEKKDAASKLDMLSLLASRQNLPIYLFIDEYDNFANTILSKPGNGKDLYKKLTHSEGFFKYFFNNIKGATTNNNAGIKKIFITGVSPLTLDDVTSGYNIGKNISVNQEFNSIVGFTKDEVLQMLHYYKSAGLINNDIDYLFSIMKEWYDNYCFSEECIESTVFNTDMVLYFISEYITSSRIPKTMIDNNVRVDYGKLKHLVVLDKKLNGNFSRIKEIAEKGEIISNINTSFPAEGLIKSENFVSMLFYFGILTIDRVEYGRTILKVPNMSIQTHRNSNLYKKQNVTKL